MNQPYRLWPFVWWLLAVALLLPLPAAAGFQLEGMACLDCHAELSKKELAHSIITDSNSCTVCHRQDNPELHGFTPFAANIGEGLCAMCHGEFPGSGELHFPVAAGDCLTCHDPHQSDRPALLKRPQGQLCFDCHASCVGNEKAHDPVEAGSCSDCHNPHRADQPNLLHAAEPELCYTCHEPFTGAGSIHVMPEEAGECSACHLPLVGDEKSLLKAPQSELCLTCHEAEAFSGVSVHGPVLTNQCSACHNPHAAELATLLRDPVPELCWRCHDQAVEDEQQIRLPATKPLFEDEKAQLHAPFVDGDCGSCHQPHAAAQVRLLSAAYPAGFYESYSDAAYELCLSCHEAGAAFNEARTLTATAFRNGNLNLHYRHVNKEKGRSCRACHTAHGGNQSRLITNSFRFGERVLGVSFVATASGGSCTTSCHIKVDYDRLEPTYNALRTSPRPPGPDATPEELQQAGGTAPR